MGILGGLRKTNVLYFDLVFDKRFERMIVVGYKNLHTGFYCTNCIVFLYFTAGVIILFYYVEKPLFLSTHAFQLFCAPQVVDWIPAHHHRPISTATTSGPSSRTTSKNFVNLRLVCKVAALMFCVLRPETVFFLLLV